MLTLIDFAETVFSQMGEAGIIAQLHKEKLLKDDGQTEYKQLKTES